AKWPVSSNRTAPAPDRQERRPVRPEVLLEGRVQRHVAPVVEDQVELDLLDPGPGHAGDVQGVPVRRDALWVAAVEVLDVPELPDLQHVQPAELRPNDRPHENPSRIETVKANLFSP